MGIINIEILNKEILNTDLFQLYLNTHPLTYQISQLPVIRPQNICDFDARNYVRSRFINNSYSGNSTLDIYYIHSFITGDNIPPEEKEKVGEQLTEEDKEKLCQMYLEQTLSKQFVTPQDVLGNYYQAKRGKKPLEFHINDENVMTVVQADIEDEQFYEYINSNKNPKEAGLGLPQALAIKHILQDNSFFSGPWVPQSMKERIKFFINPSSEQIEQHNIEISDRNYIAAMEKQTSSHEYHANQVLKDEILGNIPDDFTKLEKSIYAYYRLCEILSYDPIYYINNKTGNHTDVSNIGGYDKDNNEVVCYEFAYIYSDLLQDIGITNIHEKETRDNKFSNSHANIRFLTDGIVVFADSTRSVNEGDLTQTKFTDELNGLRCELFDQEKQRIFKASVEKVKGYLKTESSKRDEMTINPTLKNTMSENDRIVLFNNLITSSELTNTDLIAYANKARKELNVPLDFHICFDEETKSKLFLEVIINTESKHLPHDPRVEKDGISYTIDTKTKEVHDSLDGITKMSDGYLPR